MRLPVVGPGRTGRLLSPPGTSPSQLVDVLEHVYCGSVGYSCCFQQSPQPFPAERIFASGEPGHGRQGAVDYGRSQEGHQRLRQVRHGQLVRTLRNKSESHIPEPGRYPHPIADCAGFRQLLLVEHQRLIEILPSR